MSVKLPPPPIYDDPNGFGWVDWQRQLRDYVKSNVGAVNWSDINFTGSDINDIISRSHADLQGQQGGTAGEHYHLTAAQQAAVAAGIGSVTSVATSGAITGGPITTTGTISHSTADGDLHVPATSTTNNGKVLTAGATAGSISWQTPTSGSALTVKDEGSTLTTAATSMDFVGSGVTATNTGGAVTVTIPSSVGVTNLGYTASTRILTSDTGTDVTLPLVSSSDAGLAPATGGGTTNFLRADGTWAAPAGGTTESFIARTNTKTMTSNTSLQALFSGVTGATNGALTVDASTTYFFEAQISVTSMSATSGNFGFSIVGGGTATFTSAAWQAIGADATAPGTAAARGGAFVSAAGQTGNILTAATGTGAVAYIKGIFRINAGGTIIPSIQLTTAAAAVIGTNSWFKCYSVGSDTVNVSGNWS